MVVKCRNNDIDIDIYLARSANLPEGLYILLALISYFFPSLFIFFTMSTAMSVSSGPIFTIFSPNGR